jgi:hypothetical protein
LHYVSPTARHSHERGKDGTYDFKGSSDALKVRFDIQNVIEIALPQRRLPDLPQTIVGRKSSAPFLDCAEIYMNDRAVSSVIFLFKDLKLDSWT